MNRASFRLRLMLPILALAGVLAAALVGIAHARVAAQLRRTLEASLGSKSEEVQSLLSKPACSVELESFLELETSYQSSPYEYYYELVDDSGRRLASSHNLAQARIESGGAALESAPSVCAHPLRPDEHTLVRTERMPASIEFEGVAGPLLRVAVSLEPYEVALRADLMHGLKTVLLALAVLASALWIVIGRSLRCVSDITRHALAISSSNPRERLPRNGSGDELDRLAAVLNDLFADLERSLLQMESFTSDAAHQLRTPLTRIRGEIDLLLSERALAPATRARLEETRVELEHLVETCARLLLLARLDRGVLADELCADDLNLSLLAQELVEQVVPLAAEKGIEVSVVAAGHARLRGSRALLAEALLNLLDNAIRFTAPGGRIEVAVCAERAQILVGVTDTGPGVPEAERELVFQRFFRGSSAMRGDGTGLGLAIVRGIARAHGGDVTLHSPPGRGATFRLHLPAA